MKLLLRRCQICDHWHMPSAHMGHCPACGAQGVTVNGETYHVDTSTMRRIVKSVYVYNHIFEHTNNISKVLES